jgi:hypothetical protein
MDDQAIVFALAIIAIALIVWIIERPRRKVFNERFPPISDDEFMARCPPETNREIALRVRGIVSDSLGIDCERIYPSSRLVEDLDAC